VREPAPRLPWNGPLSDARRVVWAGFPLDDFLALRGAAGCKVNDIVLAVITGGLRRYLEGRGVRLDGLRARALTPVNLRQDSEHLALGNRVSAMFPWLPLGVADPRERLQRICEEMRALKERGDAQGGVLVMGLMGLMPAPLGAFLGRLSPERVLLNTVCTNVAGPRTVRFLLGRRVLEVHPIVPLFFGMGLEFAIMSYAGRLSIGVTADPHLVPDADAIADGLTAAAAELRTALGGTVVAPAPTPAGPRVADLMSRQVTAASPQDTLADAYLIMRVKRIRHLPVVDERAQLLGLVTHRDLLAASSSTLVVPSEEDRIELLARAQLFTVMETHLATAAPGEHAAEAGRRMIRHKIGCLPVVEDGRLVGIVTEEDFLRWATDHMGGAAG